MRVERKHAIPLIKATTAPAEKLKQLRERAGVTALECAQELKRLKGEDVAQASPNSWYRWESVAKVYRTALPDDTIRAAIKKLVGKGSPPVTADELLALSAGYNMLHVRAKARATGAIPARHTKIVPPVFDDVPSEPLIVRYRTEKGLFMHKSKFAKRSYGVSPIRSASDVKGEQFSALVADGPDAGTVLHCNAPAAYTKAQLLGKRVVVVNEGGIKDLVEVVVGRVDSVTGNRPKITDGEGRTINGEIYGVIVGSYTRE